MKKACCLALRSLPVVASCLAVPFTTYGFSEDLCVAKTNVLGSPIENCLTTQLCSADSIDTTRCRANVMIDAAMATTAASTGVARSMVHLDAVHFLAQVAGLDPKAAYWIAVYDEVTDVGAYIPFGMLGQAVLLDDEGAPTVSAHLNGWGRSTPESGGFIDHFVVPFHKKGEQLIIDCSDHPVPGSICGSRPDLEDPIHEGMLYHMRQWAMGERSNACVNGLTNSDANGAFYLGDTCYHDDPIILTDPSKVKRYIRGWMPSFSALNGLPTPFSAYSGNQIARFDPGNPTNDDPTDDYIHNILYADENGFETALTTEFTEGELNAVLGAHSLPELVQLIKMGLYLHVVADRISHHICGDKSSLTDPNENERFVYKFDMNECTADKHAYGHYQEVGQVQLPDRTENSLLYTLQELELFSAFHPNWQSKTLDFDSPEYNEYALQAIQDLENVLRIQDGCLRLREMIRLVDAYGFKQMPGNRATDIPLMCLAPDKSSSDSSAE